MIIYGNYHIVELRGKFSYVLSDKEFKAEFLTQATDLQKIKLAIRENRYTIIARRDKPNLSYEFLQPVLNLPVQHPVQKKLRESGRRGGPLVLIVRYKYEGMGQELHIYLKGYFAHDRLLNIEFEVQSLRQNED